MAAPSPRQRLDLVLDLQVELDKLDRLVESLAGLGAVEGDGLQVDGAALRLQSLYTGIERCLLQISRVLNGGTPDGGIGTDACWSGWATPPANGPPC